MVLVAKAHALPPANKQKASFTRGFLIPALSIQESIEWRLCSHHCVTANKHNSGKANCEETTSKESQNNFCIEKYFLLFLIKFFMLFIFSFPSSFINYNLYTMSNTHFILLYRRFSLVSSQDAFCTENYVFNNIYTKFTKTSGRYFELFGASRC